MAFRSTYSGLQPTIQLLKQRIYEPRTYNAPFSEWSLLEDDYVCEDFKSKVKTNVKMFNPQCEARKEISFGVPGVRRTIFVVAGPALEMMNEEERDFLINMGRLLVITSIERRSFIFKVMLRRIAFIREKDRDKQAHHQGLENALHSALNAIKKYKHLVYKENFKENSVEGDLPLAMKRVREEKEKVQFKMTPEDYVFLQSDTAQLCSLLGLKLEFLDALSEMPLEHRNHRTPIEWIKIFLKDNSESSVMANKKPLSKELLESIGFDPLSTAVATIMARSVFVGSTPLHIDACEWAQLFVEDEFKYNPLLSSVTSSFPFNHSLINAWFELTSIPDENIESNVDVCQVQIMNLKTGESNAYNKACTTLSASIPQENQNVVLYHGTDHESARQILLRGIVLCAGRQKRDFSCGKGFYLTKSLEDALNWAKSTTARPAVLSFVVTSSPEDVLHKAGKLSLEGNEQWRNLVSLFRNDNVTSEMLEDLDSKYDLIEGPVATVTTNETSGELLLEPKPSSYQMCLISDDMAEEFEKNLHSIVFFNLS